MDVLIVRHAHAGKPDPERWPDDGDRPLTRKGRESFAAAARGLAELGPAPSLILTSPALRARETARLLAEAMDLPLRKVKAADCLRASVSPRDCLEALAALRLPGAFAVVGHEPNLGELASLLVSGARRARLPLRKGAACLVEADALAPRGGSLAWSLPPRMLAALGRPRRA